MTRISLDEFKKDCKLKRKEHFDSPFGLAYKKYTDLGYDKKDSTYFFEHASDYVENMRKNCWDEFVPLEKEFTTEMLSCFIEEDRVRNMTPVDALKDFITEYAEHIYALALSNTQSRRSRAGKEFEAIIELLLIGADIPSDTQSAIGKEYFRNNQIGKLIDFVVPSVTGFLINKHDAMVISAKTSLRERWQEVPEELSRTGMCEVFLATVDEEISEDTLHIMYEANVRVVTTKSNKEKNYTNDNRVITFEKMLEHTRHIANMWDYYRYNEQEKKQLLSHIQKQIDKFNKYPYVKKYYKKRLNMVE